LGKNGAPSPVEHRVAALVRSPLANWFLLDSLDQTNKTPGIIGEAQRAWLEKALDENKDKPAIIVVHHNIVPPGVGAVLQNAASVPTILAAVSKPANSALLDSRELLAILRPRSHVKACIYGHTHVWNVKPD